jgi:hypothetical protein
MKTVTLNDMQYRVRECHELSEPELSEIANLLGRISIPRGQSFEKSITAFLRILLPDLTKHSFPLTARNRVRTRRRETGPTAMGTPQRKQPDVAIRIVRYAPRSYLFLESILVVEMKSP